MMSQTPSTSSSGLSLSDPDPRPGTDNCLSDCDWGGGGVKDLAQFN